MAVMTDISAVLLKSLKKRDPWDPVARQRVYTHARMAMLRKLWSLQPPLLPNEIEANVAKFDSAAARLEAEFAARSQDSEASGDRAVPAGAAALVARDEPAAGREPPRVPPRQQPPAAAPRAEAPQPAALGAERSGAGRPAANRSGAGDTAKPAARSAMPPAIRSPLNGRSAPTATILPPERPAQPAAPARPPAAAKAAPSRSQGRAYETRPVEVRPPAATRPAAPAAAREAAAGDDFYPQPSRPAAAAPRGPAPRQARPAAPGEPPQRAQRAAPPKAQPARGASEAPSPVLGAARARRRAVPEVVPEEPAPVHVERLNAYLRQVGNENDQVRPDTSRRRGIGVGQAIFGFIAAAAVGVSAWAFISYYPRLSREAALVGEAQPLDAGPSLLAPPLETVAALPPPAEAALTVAEEITLFDGRDPSVFESSPDNPIHLEGDGTNGYARVISTIASPGARAEIGPGLAQNLVGKTVRIRVAARSSATGGSALLRFAYEAAGERSQWQPMLLSPEFVAGDLIWRVPVVGRDGHAIVIEPLDGDGTAVDVGEIKIEVLAP